MKMIDILQTTEDKAMGFAYLNIARIISDGRMKRKSSLW